MLMLIMIMVVIIILMLFYCSCSFWLFMVSKYQKSQIYSTYILHHTDPDIRSIIQKAKGQSPHSETLIICEVLTTKSKLIVQAVLVIPTYARTSQLNHESASKEASADFSKSSISVQ